MSERNSRQSARPESTAANLSPSLDQRRAPFPSNRSTPQHQPHSHRRSEEVATPSSLATGTPRPSLPSLMRGRHEPQQTQSPELSFTNPQQRAYFKLILEKINDTNKRLDETNQRLDSIQRAAALAPAAISPLLAPSGPGPQALPITTQVVIYNNHHGEGAEKRPTERAQRRPPARAQKGITKAEFKSKARRGCTYEGCRKSRNQCCKFDLCEKHCVALTNGLNSERPTATCEIHSQHRQR